jgi:hypothetical protein
MPMFLLPATAGIMLRSRTWMSDVAIANALRNYGASGEPFTVKSTRPGNHHYLVRPVRGGFYVTSGPLSALTWAFARAGS